MGFSDVVKVTTGADETEGTNTMEVSGGSKIVELSASWLDTDGMPYQIRIDFPGITTPKKYCIGAGGTGTLAQGFAGGVIRIPVDIDLPSNVSKITIGVTAEAAAVDVFVGVRWV